MIPLIAVSLLATIFAGTAAALWFRLKKTSAIHKRQVDLSEAGILASGLAHEIRNPLNSIKINIQLLQEDLEEAIQDESVKEEFQETIRLVTYEIGRLNELMTNFLTYARPTELKREDLDLTHFLDELIQFLKKQADEKGVILESSLPESAVMIRGDSRRLRQALMNILINDIQIVPEKGRIQVSLKAVRDLAVIRVEDTGPGMTEEFMREIFVAFRSQRRGGTGLGLSIANKFIEAHGGGIKVESTVGKGTVFSVILPLKQSESQRT
ncbi:MAG: hypothetical protein GXO69_10835 [Acidobacteria bacterium]|nr:hypothetical protein [Acidobacteriota bacterium]